MIDVTRATLRTVATVNPQVSEWTIARTEVVTWKNALGIALEGVLTVPPHTKAGAPPPLLVLPHGGPDWVTLETFDAWSQFFAARGYSVFQPNYQGGIGYGRAFYEANRGKFGDIELGDIESGVDHLIASGKADPARLVYGGWSWGGYLSAWTLGHSDRYRAFVVGAGITDVVLQYVTSDINHGAIADWEYRGQPFTAPETFARANPIGFVRTAKRPTLILHGEQDSRVPLIHALVLHRALSDLGVDVTTWVYPREGHAFQEPAHVEHMLEVWASFYDRHLTE